MNELDRSYYQIPLDEDDVGYTNLQMKARLVKYLSLNISQIIKLNIDLKLIRKLRNNSTMQ